MLSPVTPELVASLRGRLPADVFRTSEPRYFEEPRGRWTGEAGLVLAPTTTDQVATILAACHEAHVGVVPYAGGTGLVGGQIAPMGGGAVLLSVERMTRIRAVHADENVLIAEAGVILADIQTTAEAAGRLFPLSLASEGSARIGGNLATNAGGTAVLRYGNMRDLCLGLEAVLPDGQVWHGLSRLRKDNTGYDLRGLLVGSEGTLGVITAASLKLYPRPAATGTALFVVPDPAAALRLLTLARDRFGEAVSTFELISGQGLRFLAEKLPDIRQPFATPPDWSVLVEVGLARGLDPAGALEDLFAEALEAGLTEDGLIAQNRAQADDFWAVREQIPEANRRIGSVSSHDISVPLSAIPDFIAEASIAVARIGDFRINCFGHVGDGNLHFNIFPAPGRSRADHENQRPVIKAAIHDLVHAFEGSVSAEHGIGRLKVADLARYGDPVKRAAMRAIKDALDPHGIMNPGAVLTD